MFAIDTNLLVYAHNTASPYHTQAKAFVEAVMNTRDEDGNLSVCLPAQVLMEFVHVITWQHLEAPLSLSAAIRWFKTIVILALRLFLTRRHRFRRFSRYLRHCQPGKKSLMSPLRQR